MDMREDIELIERSARDAGLSMRAACLRAGIHPTTVCRWKSGVSKPLLESVRKLEDAIASASGGTPIGKVRPGKSP